LAVLKIKQVRQNLTFQLEWLGSGKTLSELHIHYKSLLTRVYDHAGCTEHCRFHCCLNVIDVIDKKQMYDSIITEKMLLKIGIVLYRCF